MTNQVSINEVWDDSGQLAAYMAKGHISRQAIEQAITWQMGDDVVPDNWLYRQTYLRVVPAAHYSDFQSIYCFIVKPAAQDVGRLRLRRYTPRSGGES